MIKQFLGATIAAALMAMPAYAQKSVFELVPIQQQPQGGPGGQGGANSGSAEQEHPLTETNGPYLVRVSSFTGPDAASLANSLANELRKEHEIEAYTFRFQLDADKDRPPQAMIDEYVRLYKVQPPLTKLMTPPPENWLVLAGNFENREDWSAKLMLRKIRKIKPKSVPNAVLASMRFNVDPTASQEVQKKLRDKIVEEAPSPFKKAMLVRNPVLIQKEEEARLAAAAGGAVNVKSTKPTIDPETAKMLRMLNDEEKYSIYKLDAPYTIEVAQFSGILSTNEEAKKGRAFGKGKTGLQIAGENAVILCEEMRKRGYEAFVFHGKFASLVCVGGYDRNDPRLAQDFQTFGQLKINELRLEPQIIPTPRRPE